MKQLRNFFRLCSLSCGLLLGVMMALPVNARPRVVPLAYEGVDVETLLAVYKEAHLLAGFEFSGQVVDKDAAKNGAHVVRPIPHIPLIPF